jgi:peptidoglycan hydrolase CwlO-like protein
VKKRKLIVLAVALSIISLIVLQVASAGHGHVVVVGENIKLETKNTSLTNQNKQLKGTVNSLQTKNSELQTTNNQLQTQVEQVSAELNVMEGNLKQVSKELKHEKSITGNIDNGDEFNFSPITLPTSDSLQR